jgi:small subunit ribosomal protein S16
MLMIRLQRVGRKHEPVFRLVLTDSKNSTKSGRFLEILGNYDARRGEKAEFKVERVKELIATGAKLSDTVHNLFISRKIIEGKKINNLPKKKPIISEEAKAAALAAETAEKEAKKAAEAPAPTEEPKIEEKVEETPSSDVATETSA